jgi:hypothetical protein
MVTIVLHSSQSRYGNSALITKWHVLPKEKVTQNSKIYQGNGWSNIGYHRIILNGWIDANHYSGRFDGHVETGRPLDDDHYIDFQERGAHVAGFNKNSIGICLIGMSGQFTDNQLNSAIKEIYFFEKQFIEIKIKQHSELDPKKPYCAGLDMDKFKKNYELYKEMQRIDEL